MSCLPKNLTAYPGDHLTVYLPANTIFTVNIVFTNKYCIYLKIRPTTLATVVCLTLYIPVNTIYTSKYHITYKYHIYPKET